MHRRFQEFVISTNSNIIDTSVIINWKATLGKEREWHLGALKGFLLSWHEYGYYGVDKSVVSLLESFTLSGNEKDATLTCNSNLLSFLYIIVFPVYLVLQFLQNAIGRADILRLSAWLLRFY